MGSDNVTQQAFDHDMSSVNAAIGRVQDAISAVRRAMGPHVWMGREADDWWTDYSGRLQKLSTMLDQARAEQPRLLTQAMKQAAGPH